MKFQRISKGFTLLEVLVALTIFAVMAIAAYRGLDTLLVARERITQENQKWRNVALFFARMENDLEAAMKRPVRGVSDLVLPPLTGSPVTSGQDEAQLTFTRSGYAGQEGKLTAPQRVGYRLQEGRIEWLSWPVLDQAPRTRPDVNPALEQVAKFDLRYLDQTGNWQTQWPSPVPEIDPWPAAIEVNLTLQSGEVLQRIFALP